MPITFTWARSLGDNWDIMVCSECHALVSEEHEDEHREWHDRHPHCGGQS